LLIYNALIKKLEVKISIAEKLWIVNYIHFFVYFSTPG